MPGFDPHRVRLHGSGGRAGLLALCMTTNTPSRVADAYEHPSFNPVVDREGKYRTRSMRRRQVSLARGLADARTAAQRPADRGKERGSGAGTSAYEEGSSNENV